MNDITVVRAGLLTTIQDAGRWGHQAEGVPVSGPMDPFSCALANLLVGNHEGEAALEATLQGPELRFDTAAGIAIGGADFSATIIDDAGSHTLAPWTPSSVPAGATLRFGERRARTRAYVAVRGGIDVPAVLGSRATSVQARLPGFAGRALRAGDVLGIADRAVGSLQDAPTPSAQEGFSRYEAGGVMLRFIWGPDADLFTSAQRAQFVGAAYRLSNASNRMGYRLQGPRIAPTVGATLLSEATPLGTIQCPPSGDPILLMADRQTTGGYPRIGTVISADISEAGQLAPGDTVRFVPCELQDAIALMRERQGLLQRYGGRRDR